MLQPYILQNFHHMQKKIGTLLSFFMINAPRFVHTFSLNKYNHIKYHQIHSNEKFDVSDSHSIVSHLRYVGMADKKAALRNVVQLYAYAKISDH